MNFKTKAVTQINIVQERITDMIAVLVNTEEKLIKLLAENRELGAQVKNNKADRDMKRSGYGKRQARLRLNDILVVIHLKG